MRLYVKPPTERVVNMAYDPASYPELLTPAEVSALFGVNSKTVSRWAKAGKLISMRTPGGHRRYLRDHVMALLQDETPDQKSS